MPSKLRSSDYKKLGNSRIPSKVGDKKAKVIIEDKNQFNTAQG